MLAKRLVVFISALLLWGTSNGFSEPKHGKERRQRVEKMREVQQSRASERHKSHHETHHKSIEKREAGIKGQYDRKIDHLGKWKTKHTEKCAGDQTCLDRVSRIYEKRKAQINKQHEKRTMALEKFKEKHEGEEHPGEAVEGEGSPEEEAPEE